MRILVTGGRGRLAQALMAANKAVVALPRSRLDLTKPSDIERELGAADYSAVLNAAGVSNIEAAEAAPDLAHAANALGPEFLAKACARRCIPMVHISTDYVFGAASTQPWRETDPVSPINAYGRSKAEGEVRVLMAGTGGHIVVRVAWLFGDNADFIARMLQTSRHGPTRVLEDQVGSPTPLAPLAGKLLMLCRRLSEGDSMPPILHLAGIPPVSRADWVTTAFSLLEQEGIALPPPQRVKMNSFRSSVMRPNFSALDSTLSASHLEGFLDWKEWLAINIRAYTNR